MHVRCEFLFFVAKYVAKKILTAFYMKALAHILHTLYLVRKLFLQPNVTYTLVKTNK